MKRSIISFAVAFVLFSFVGCGAIKVADIALPETMKTDTIYLKGTYKFNLKGGKIIFGDYRSDKLRSGSFQFGLPIPFTGFDFRKRKNMFSFILHTRQNENIKVSGFAKASTINSNDNVISFSFAKNMFKGKKFEGLDLSNNAYTVHIRGDNPKKYWLSVFDMTNNIDAEELLKKGRTERTYKGMIEAPNGDRILMKQITKTKTKQLGGNSAFLSSLATIVYGYNFIKDGSIVATASLNKRGWICLKKYLSQGEKDAIVAVVSSMMLRGAERMGDDSESATGNE